MWTLRWLNHWLVIFFHLDIRWNNRLQSSSQIRAAWEEKQHLSCLWSPFATPAKSRYAALWRAEPDTSHYCPAFETNPAWHSLSYHIRLNLLITCSCHFTVKSDRLGWSYSPLTLTPSPHFPPHVAEKKPQPLISCVVMPHWTLTLLGLSLWGSNTLSQRRRPVSCLSCCR